MSKWNEVLCVQIEWVLFVTIYNERYLYPVVLSVICVQTKWELFVFSGSLFSEVAMAPPIEVFQLTRDFQARFPSSQLSWYSWTRVKSRHSEIFRFQLRWTSHFLSHSLKTLLEKKAAVKPIYLFWCLLCWSQALLDKNGFMAPSQDMSPSQQSFWISDLFGYCGALSSAGPPLRHHDTPIRTIRHCIK